MEHTKQLNVRLAKEKKGGICLVKNVVVQVKEIANRAIFIYDEL
jgi:hypothetical protein